ncbi:MAG: phospholipase D family protein [Bacteriovoracaceae bacterium]|jgi:cardiolipin synthase C|nr:phospholipase D family protein [Bacteriovoracaceae bacterium]
MILRSLKIFLFIQLLLIQVVVFAQDNQVNTDPNRDSRDDIFSAQSTEDHKLTILNGGLSSLQQRINLIEKAQKNIEVEYFIYHADETGRLLTHALIERAREGVKVRVLLDHFLIKDEIDPFIAHELIEAGVEVRFYNTVPIIRIFDFQYRNHRKLLSIDDKFAITGGRNIGNEYFDMSNDFNFIDRDIMVEGPIVKNMRKSFDAVWRSDPVKYVKRYKRPRKKDLRYRRSARSSGRLRNYNSYLSDLKRWKDRARNAFQFMKVTNSDIEFKRKVFTLTLPQLEVAPFGICNNISFTSDAPGMGRWARSEPFRKLRQDVFSRMRKVEQKLIIDSPYFILEKTTAQIINDLLDRNVSIDLLTNSLHSTDAIYVSSVFNDRISPWIKRGLRPVVYSGNIMPGYETLSQDVHLSRWGTHSKGVVFDEDSIMIGTFNFDPRSINYNTELAVFCDDNPDLASKMALNIQDRIDNGILLETAADVKKYEFTNVGLLKRLGYYLVKIPAALFDYML